MTTTSRSGSAFAASVGRWTIRMKDMTKIVWQESLIELVRRMQNPVSVGGRMPVRTGFLRSSLRFSTSPIAIASVQRPGPGPYSWAIDDFVAFVKTVKMGQQVYLGYIAKYIYLVEYGHGNVPGYGFQRLAVQAWPSIVKNKVAEIRSR